MASTEREFFILTFKILSGSNVWKHRYGRILARIQDSLHTKEKHEACRILEWIGCATAPPRKEELLQAIIIKPGGGGFSKSRKAFRDILKLCGPIIEIENDVVQFVHFTAKE